MNLFPRYACYPIDYIKYHSYLNHFYLLSCSMLMEGFRYLHWGLLDLGWISSTKIDDRKFIKSGKSATQILHSEFKSLVLPLLEGNNKGHKRDTQTQTQTHTYTQVYDCCSNFSKNFYLRLTLPYENEEQTWKLDLFLILLF